VTFLVIFTKLLTEFLSDLLQEIILEFSKAKLRVMIKLLSVFAKDAQQFARVAQHVSVHEWNLESKYMLSNCSINYAA
jgi:predicted permease